MKCPNCKKNIRSIGMKKLNQKVLEATMSKANKFFEKINKKDFRQKCAVCKKTFPSKELVNSFKIRKCKKCLAIKRISKINAVIIPQFMMRKYKLFPECQVRLIAKKEGIFIKKLNKEVKLK